MPSPKALKELSVALRAINQKMPPGGSFKYQVHDDHLWLEILLVPKHARGQGTALLSRILAAADQAGVRTALLADPTDQPGDPTAFEIVRWYGRFGFAMLAATEDGVAMERAPRARPVPAAEIERAARAAKAHDLTGAEYARFIESGAPAASGPVRAGVKVG